MSGARTAKDIFLDAADLPSGERDRFLAEACKGDSELKARVESLLRAHTNAERLIPDDPIEVTSQRLDDLRPDEWVGRYRLVSVLGEGGFGTVWLAEQEEPVRRQAAVKVLKSGAHNREVTIRFEAERQALAMMDHPGIAKVFDGGTTESGRPYFAMELVDGIPLVEYVKKNELDLIDRLELYLEVCRAVQHAHQKGVIHRDLKPSNVLVTVVDGRPTPKVIDFGIAKAVEGTLTDSSMLTLDGQLIGTPAYMSPEQVSGSEDIDTRSDVYSLGVLLYELLCDATPFGDKHASMAGLAELQRQIQHSDPTKPSTRIAENPIRQANITERSVRGDLDWIVMCCLEKDRERRYDSADVLANEIARHLNGDPVLAGPPDLGYRVSKFARRHRAALFSITLIVVLLIGGIFATVKQLNRALAAETELEIEAQNVKNELQRYELIAEFLQDVVLSVSPEEAEGHDRQLLLNILGRAQRRVDRLDGSIPTAEASLRRIIGCAFLSLGDFEKARPQLEQALELRRDHLGPKHKETLESLLDLGTYYLKGGQYKEAEPFLKEHVDSSPEVLGTSSEETRSGRVNFATLLRMLGKTELAESQYRQLLKDTMEVYGEKNENTIRVLNNLAGVLDDLERSDESIMMYERALELQLEVQGETHPEALMALNNFAGSMMDNQRYEEALPMLQKALRIKKTVLLPQNPSLAIAYNNLGDCLRELKRYEEAVEHYRKGLEIAISGQGEDSRPAYVLKHNMSDALRRLGEVEEALDMMQDAYDGFVRMDSKTAPGTLGTMDQLARLHRLNGDEELAVEMSTRLMELCKETFPPDHRNPAFFRLHHGENLAGVGRMEEALAEMLAAHEILEVNGTKKLVTSSIETIAKLYALMGNEAEAAAWRAKLPTD